MNQKPPNSMQPERDDALQGGCLFAAIADDYTGGSDLAGMLFAGGVRTVLIFGVPPSDFLPTLPPCYQAAVLCLKSRSIPAGDACRISLNAVEALSPLHAPQVQFKYCSTFDSTAEGNIGPVTEALMDRLGAEFTVAVPALPVNGRTQYLGHLFVGHRLLSDSHMRDHPVNPMRQPNLVLHLQRQSRRKVGLVCLPAVQAGADSIRREMVRLRGEGVAIALVDAVHDRDLEFIAEAVADLPFITGGSGLGMKLPAIWRGRGRLAATAAERSRDSGCPGTVVLSGSCSAATLQQLDSLRASGCTMIPVKVARLLSQLRADEVDRLFTLGLDAAQRTGRAAIYSSAPAPVREQLYQEAASNGFDMSEVSARIETTFGELARRFVAAGIQNLVIAGGETAGAAVNSLRIKGVEITAVLDPGVPSVRSLGDSALGLVLKSGNFGSPDFFNKAIHHLEGS
jgi:uncharacterized protein YgbK (DUF1537 family)